ncbi:hypothetical protein MAUB1S_04196 [Mycolicibacterium aubagnense]
MFFGPEFVGADVTLASCFGGFALVDADSAAVSVLATEALGANAFGVSVAVVGVAGIAGVAGVAVTGAAAATAGVAVAPDVAADMLALETAFVVDIVWSARVLVLALSAVRAIIGLGAAVGAGGSIAVCGCVAVH